jgi:hypothetical protein
MTEPRLTPGATNLLESQLLDRNSVAGRTVLVPFQTVAAHATLIRLGQSRLVDFSFPWPVTLSVTLLAQIPFPFLAPVRGVFPTFRINRGAQGADDVQTVDLGIRPDARLSVAENAAVIRRELTVTCQAIQIDVDVLSIGTPLPLGTNGLMSFAAYISPSAVQPTNQRVAATRADIVRSTAIPFGTVPPGILFPADTRRIAIGLFPSAIGTAMVGTANLTASIDGVLLADPPFLRCGGAPTIQQRSVFLNVPYTGEFRGTNSDGAVDVTVTEYLSSDLGGGF